MGNEAISGRRKLGLERVLGWSPLRVLLCGSFAFGGALLSAGGLLRFVSSFTTSANWEDPIPIDAPNSLLIVLAVAGVLYAFAAEWLRACDRAKQGRWRTRGLQAFVAAVVVVWIAVVEIAANVVW